MNWGYMFGIIAGTSSKKKQGLGSPDKAGSNDVTVLLLALKESWPCQGTETLPGRPPYHP